MSKRYKFWSISALVIAMASPGLAQEVTTDTVVASINGEDITVGHLIVARGDLPPQYINLPDEVLYEGLLENLIQQTILAQAAGDPLPQAAVLALENDRRGVLAGTVIDLTIQAAVTEDVISATYEAFVADIVPELEYNASHILLETEDQALAIQVQLAEGADFAELAKEKSTGPSGPNGGNLDWFGKGAMVPEFEEAMLALEVGAVSDPVQTQFGWHVIRLNETRDVPVPSLEELRDELAIKLQRDAVEARITELTVGTEITRIDPETIDPSVLSTLELTAE